PAPTDLRAAFPDQAAGIIASGRGFDDSDPTFVLRPEVGRWGPSKLEVLLPKTAKQPVRMRLDALNMDVTIHEIDLTGAAERDGEAIRYSRAGGLSYWAGIPGGVEEWLVLDNGVADYAVPVASWIVGGATLAQQGPAVIVH